ncbi:MAG TPA: glycoside hydrolase family 44 protein, partial [Candidatus Paceibacterota bacterium]|nr:glycoside hydrolase family 44 protein [Candidatus Paceibacterota bacterium]
MLAFRRLETYFTLGSIFIVASTTALAQNPAATINVNANGNRHSISPLIYGANWADTSMITDLNLTINRRGGNATTTYNWKTNATNRGGDWYFESLSDGPAVASDSANQFINSTKAGGAESMITIPLVDWLAKLGPNRSGLTPYSIAKYGPQTSHDPWWSDAGNGIGTNAATGATWKILTNNPADAYVTNSPAYQKEWVQYLTNRYGISTNGGVRFYLMDNEHAVWPSNHRPIMPVGQTMDQIRDRIFAYGGVVKAVDPNALVVGPEEWGWPNYFTSPYDSQVPGGTDRAAHGGWDYMPWLLNQFKLTNNATGKRLLDVFSLHYYPQYNEFGLGDSDPASQLKRNECTRDLWDPNY